MVIYHGITTWHILECWVHKLIKHSDDESILILPDFILDKHPKILNIFPKEIFTIKIIRYCKLDFRVKKELFEQMLQTLINELNVNEYLNELTEIYVAGAQYMFSHYLIQKGIHFHFFEEAPGRLTTSEIVQDNLRSINKIQYEIALEDGMFIGNSSLVKSIICNRFSQKENIELPNNIEDFDVVLELQNISEENIEKIKHFFNLPSVSFPYNTALVLTQHFANLNMTSYAEQALIYQMTVDYFLENNQIYVKPHPDDLMNYKEVLQECEMIKGTFPSELLPTISENKPVKLVTISSASVLNFKKYYDEIIAFNSEYLHTFYMNHQYFLFVNIVKDLGAKGVAINKINMPQLENMMKKVNIRNINIQLIEEKNNDWSIFLGGKDCDNMSIQDVNTINKENKVFIFLDAESWLKFSGGRDACLTYGICKPIYVSAIDKEEYPETGIFYLYIYCENEEIRKRVAKMYYVKKLINSGIETTVPKLDDKDMEIAILKGILAATEKRLSAYLDNERNSKTTSK